MSETVETLLDRPLDAGSSAGSSIVVNDRPLPEITADAVAVLRRSPDVYVRDGQLVRLRAVSGKPRIETMSQDALRGELARRAEWVRVLQAKKQTVEVAAYPPMDAVRDVLALPEYPDFIRPLVGLAEAPFLSPSGELVTQTGYHAGSRMYLHLDLALPPVPEEPTAGDVRRAVALVQEPFVDFPFASPSSRTHALAMMLNPFLRPYISGPVPLMAADAPTPGTGKGLLVDACSTVACGRRAEIMSLGADDAEIKRQITGVVLSGQPFAALDNISATVDSGALAAMLTSETWRDRPVRSAYLITLPMRTIWTITANNIKLSGELARRSIIVRLDAKVAKPDQRTGFKHSPLLDWVAANRADVMWGALVLTQHWLREGCPEFTAQTKGSFEVWARVLGGVLGAAGLEDGFLAGKENAQANTEDQAWDMFVAGWWEQYKDKPTTVLELGGLAEFCFVDVMGRDHGASVKLGKKLIDARDRMFEVGGQTVALRSVAGGVVDSNANRKPAYRLEPA